jgi:hypothetical protein
MEQTIRLTHPGSLYLEHRQSGISFHQDCYHTDILYIFLMTGHPLIDIQNTKQADFIKKQQSEAKVEVK